MLYEILSAFLGNNWNLTNSYKEIEQLCISTGQKNRKSAPPNSGMHSINASPSHSNAIDVGLGPAVHLDQVVANNSPQHNPVKTQLIKSQGKIGSANNVATLGRNGHQPLPTKVMNATNYIHNSSNEISSSNLNNNGNILVKQTVPPISNNAINANAGGSTERIIPIQVLSSKPQQSQTPLSGGGLTTQTSGRILPKQPRAVLEEPVLPSQPTMVPPSDKKEFDEEAENDDVFDEKQLVIRRSVNNCKCYS